MAKPLIMIVEDEHDVAKTLAQMLESSGKYSAVVANSAKEAFETLKKNKTFFGLFPNKIRCVLLDIKMPEMDGLEFLKKMREEYKERIAVMMVTAYEDEEKWDKAAKEFISGYIRKPVKRDDLIARLDRLFASPDAENEMIVDTLVEGADKQEEFDKKRGL